MFPCSAQLAALMLVEPPRSTLSAPSPTSLACSDGSTPHPPSTYLHTHAHTYIHPRMPSRILVRSAADADAAAQMH
eukprot:scaffold66342_cov21-Tisochrysis_lutea.AAC.1